jgi:N-acetylglucosamine-6-phosphate deacetylase
MSKADWLIYNGYVLADTRCLPRGFVCLEGERISSLGEDWRGVEAERMIDAGGRLVGPGFIDMHKHGIADVDFMQSDPAAMLRGLALYASFGIRRVLGSTYANPYDTIIEQRHRLRQVMQDREHGAVLHTEYIWKVRGFHRVVGAVTSWSTCEHLKSRTWNASWARSGTWSGP